MDIYLNKTINFIRLAIVGFILLLGVALLLFTIFLALYHPDFEPAAFAALAFSSLFLIFAMYHTLKLNLSYKNADHPILTINQDGLYDRRVTKRAVPWDLIEWRYIVMKGNPSVSFNILRNEFSYLHKQGLTDRLMAKLSRLFGFPKYNVDLMSLKEDPVKIKTEIEKYKKSM